MKRVIIVGSGAGGATAARELQGRFDVTVLEEGGGFKPFGLNLTVLEKLRKTGLFIDEREIQLLFPAMKIMKTADKVTMVRGKGLGGTTAISAGNAFRQDVALKKLGINLDKEFNELHELINISTNHKTEWNETTNRLFKICEELKLDPFPLPKFGDYDKCTGCGRCVLGCRYGAKWDSRRFLTDAENAGAKVITKCKVIKTEIHNGRVRGVTARKNGRPVFFQADFVVLAAGGFSTPLILQNSGIECESKLFVDPVLCVAARYKNAKLNTGVSMPFAAQREHYILSPYFDFLSFFFNKSWHGPGKDIISLMIKLADENIGGVADKAINKELTFLDKERLQDGVALCTDILLRMGVRKDDIFLGTVNAGHPGGMLPLTENEAESLRSPRLPENLYIADATLFPESLGNPPILTVMALAKKVGKVLRGRNALT